MQSSSNTLAATLVVLALGMPASPAVVREDPPAPRPTFELQEQLALLARDDAIGRAAMETLSRQGEVAALAALAEISSADVLARRRRAHLVVTGGGSSCVVLAIAALADPDAGTRAELIAFLARVDLGAVAAEERARVLAERALIDPDPGLRARSLDLLASLDRPESTARLDDLVDRLEEPLRARAAALLADSPRSIAIVERRVPSAAPEMRGPLLSAYGRRLGERPGAGSASPLLLGLRHPDTRVVRGAEIGLDACLRRLYSLADSAGAARAIRDLETIGLDRDQGALLRARAALAFGADPSAALAAARELAAASPPGGVGGDEEARTARALARYLEAAALVASGDPETARGPLLESQRLLEGLLAERADLGPKSLASLHVVRLHRRAQCELLEIVRTLADSEEIADPGSDPRIARCLEAARTAHALELEAQIAATDANPFGDANLDPLLDDDLSPGALFLANPRLAAWPSRRGIEVRAAIGRLFASVASSEMPGFEPYSVPSEGARAELSDPLADSDRLDLLRRLLRARLDAVASRMNALLERVRGEMASDPSAPSDEDAQQMDRLVRERDDLLDASRRAFSGSSAAEADPSALLESRAPSLYGLTLARALRDEGRAGEARALAEAVKTDLDRSGDLKRYLLFEAEIEMAIGSTWIDSDDPSRAEVELVRAVERLEAVESAVRERGASPRDLAAVRGMRASALVSLAVNANVKMGDPEKALGYFERAFELRQDEFMRVLLACYRARSGRAEEARSMLREIRVSPGNLYNAACTWALVGDRELALDCLRRDLEENLLSEGARTKQREWARRDPDLASLRGDPRFVELVGP